MPINTSSNNKTNSAESNAPLSPVRHTTRPVWLFSMDSDNFYAAPTTTAGLKAYYQQYGSNPDQNDIELVHFRDGDAVSAWHSVWKESVLPKALDAIANGVQPVAGFSFYTWNAAEFIQLVAIMKQDCPELLTMAGGPHVQQAEDYLGEDPIDLIILGEGEATFQELLDCDDKSNWPNIDGIGFLDEQGNIVKTTGRARQKNLDLLPSPLSVLELCDSEGKPLYDSISYETSRGCPFSCAFCEWGTGAIGTKMIQFSMDRLREDWRTICESGIKDIWLADSNFGALKQDLEKAQLICDLKAETGCPTSFATSWSKKHSPRVQEIALLLNKHGLLPHYQLALQTLTPLALELSNRKNMASNKYEPIAKEMANQGVPIAAELIWGLPGDNLNDFEKNLDTLLATFLNINIFGYTLLPGTEFYEKRELYQIKTLPVAGYGKAKGEYVIGCHTFDENEGMEGYFLITAHIIFVHGCLLPMTVRHMALTGDASVSPMLRHLLRACINHFSAKLPTIDWSNRLEIYENRSALYLTMLAHFDECYELIRSNVEQWLRQEKLSEQALENTLNVLSLDQAISPKTGESRQQWYEFNFDAETAKQKLDAMELPEWQQTIGSDRLPQRLLIESPGGVGEILQDPDGGSWLKGKVLTEQGAPLPAATPIKTPIKTPVQNYDPSLSPS